MGPEYTSLEGEAFCNRATRGFYWDSIASRPLPCPLGAICDEKAGTTEKTIRLEQHYFRLHDLATVIYPCDTGNCEGDYGNGTTTCRQGSSGIT